MITKEAVMIVTSDVSGQVRGKGFPVSNLEKRLKRGVGWVPTNVQITCLNGIADSPYGSVDDLILVPDPATEVRVDFEDGQPVEHFFIGDILDLDGFSWECCTRGLAQKALAALEKEAGLYFNAAFEHEFFYTGADQTGWNGFSLDSYRKNALFAQTLLAALEKAGIDPDTFLPEYGPGQFETTISPSIGIKAADQSLILKEMARATAARFGERVSFSPIVSPGNVGNGVHIHFSLLDKNKEPVTYDRKSKTGLSKKAGMFSAGILKYMPAITAIMAPSVISYQRLTPHKWSAAFNNLAICDREAGLRICPVIRGKGRSEAKASQFNLEYRGADAAASPYLQLAALVMAGLQGIRDNLANPKPTQGDLSQMSTRDLDKMGVVRLPDSLEKALGLFKDEPMIEQWFSKAFADIYLGHKLQEIKDMAVFKPRDMYTLYSTIY